MTDPAINRALTASTRELIEATSMRTITRAAKCR